MLSAVKHFLVITVLIVPLFTEYYMVTILLLWTGGTTMIIGICILGVNHLLQYQLETLSEMIKELWKEKRHLRDLNYIDTIFYIVTATDIVLLVTLAYTQHFYTMIVWTGICAYYYTLRNRNIWFIKELRKQLEEEGYE